MTGRLRLLALAFLGGGLLFAAEPRQWPFGMQPESLAPPELENDSVFDLTFDSDGASRVKNVWLATPHGLLSYDGYRWTRHGMRNGLPSDFVRCVLRTKEGDLWVGTDKGAGVYDGQVFHSRGSETGLAGSNVRRIVQDREGSLWFSSDSWPKSDGSGGIARLRGGVWRAWHKSDGLPENYVVNQFTDSHGRKFALTSGGPARLVGDRWVAERFASLRPGVHWGSSTMVEAPGLGTVLSNGTEVFALDAAGLWRPVGDPPLHEFGLLATRDGRLVIAADTTRTRKAFHEWTGSEWKPISLDFAVPRRYGEEFREAPDGSFWYVGASCLIRWQTREREWDLFPNAPGDLIPDAEDRIWSFTGGDLFELQSGAWVKRGRQYLNAVPDLRTGVWAIAERTIDHWRPGGKLERWPASETGLRSLVHASIDGKGRAWLVGQDELGMEAVAVYSNARWRRVELPWRRKAARLVRAENPGSGLWYLSRDQATREWHAAHVGEKIEEFSVPEAATSQFSFDAQADGEGALWVSGDRGIHRLGIDRKWVSLPELPAMRFTTPLSRGRNLWFLADSTFGGQSGLLHFLKDRREFFPGQWNAISLSPDGTVIASGKGSVSLMEPLHGADLVEVRVPGEQEAGSAFRDRSGAIWVATSVGLARMKPDRIPPETEIVTITGDVLVGQPFLATARAIRKFGAPGAEPATFSWRLDSGNWSQFTRAETFRLDANQIGLGAHRIYVRARDNGLDVDPTAAEVEFSVRPLPLQERGWFLPALVTGLLLLATSTTAALLARRRLAIQARDLEVRVRERTALLTGEINLRKDAETELRASEANYRRIVETAQEGIARFDENGKCVMTNAEFARIAGLTVDQALGRYFQDVSPPEFTAAVVKEMERQGGGAIRDFELPLRIPGSPVTYVAISARQTPGPDGRILDSLVTLADISARKQAEESLRRSEAYYRLLFDDNPNPMFVVDLESSAFLSVNRAACETYGYSRDELLQVGAGALLPDAEAKDQIFSGRGQALTGAVAWRSRIRCRNECWIDVEIWGHDVTFEGRRARLLIAIDISARVRAVKALEESEANLAEAQRIAHVGSFRTGLDAFGQYGEWSVETCRILGVSRTHPQSLEDLLAFVDPGERQELRRAIERTASQRGTLQQDIRVLRPDGKARHVRLTAVVQEGVEPLLLTGTLQDITEYRELQDRLNRAERLESIGQLAGGVAHDFNNLLTVINGFGARVLKRLDPASDIHEDLSQVINAGKDAAGLTQRLLAFSRKQMMKPSTLDLNATIQQSYQMLSRLIGEHIRVELKLHPEPLWVTADAVQLQQVFLNLSVNARDAMPEGGTLTIRTSKLVLDEAFARMHPGAPPEPAVLVEVIDTGCGMSPETQRRVFEPFFTTKGSSGGSGLGLPTVYGIVQQSGGSIEVASAPGAGTTFRIYLPEASAKTAEPVEAAPSRPVETAAAGSRSILVVEDREEVRRFTASALRKAGYVVFEAGDGPSAIALASRNPDGIDLLLTDVMMPGMSGRVLASKMQPLMGTNRTIPVIFVSAFAEELFASGGDGENRLLRKPFTEDELLERVRGALASV